MRFIGWICRALGTAGRATIALIGLGVLFAAAANYTMTQGAGTTFASAVISGANYVEFLICDATAGATQCAAVTASNALKVDGSAVTQPVSGTVTANAGTNLNTSALATSANQTNGTQTTGIVGGSAIIGKVGIDQTTPGTTNGAGAAQATVSAGNTLNAVVANTTGTSIPVTGYGAALFNVNCSVNCSGGTTVNFQASDVVGFQAVGAMPVAGGSAMVTSVLNQSGAAMFCVPNFGYTNMRANVTGYSAGTITVTITPINAASCDVAQVANALAAVANNAAIAPSAGLTNSPVVDFMFTLQSGATGGKFNSQISCDNHVFKHITTATDTLAVQGVASQTIYVCSWRSRAAGVATWFLENTASANANCSSANTQITGVATEAANTGETWGGNFWSGLKNTSGNGLCINSTGTGGVDVDVWYTQF